MAYDEKLRQKPEQESSREQDYLKTGRFFENYKEDLHKFFNAFDWEWSEDPAEVNRKLHKMIGLDHADTSGLQEFTPEQTEAGMALADETGLIQEILPTEPADYDDILEPGATTMGMKRRLVVRANVLAAGSTTKKTTILNGQRPRGPLDRTNEEILEAFSVSEKNPWIQHELASPKPFSSETHLGRAAALGLLNDPRGHAHRMDLPLIGTTSAKREPGAEPRDITDYYYRDADGQEIVVLNGRSVDRGYDDNGKKRDPRPTAGSTIEEYLERHTPSEGDRILFVASQPHALRMGREFQEALERHGLHDVQVDLASASAPATTKLHTVLGELARMLDREINSASETEPTSTTP